MEAVEELDAWKRELVQLHLFKTRVQEEQAELANGMEKYERRRQVGKPEYHIRTMLFRLDPVPCFSLAWRFRVRTHVCMPDSFQKSRVEPENVCFFVPSFAS
jgi:hypothetical protein